MSSVDNRVVNLKFDNKEFVSNITSTLKSLDKLKDNLDMSDAVDEFNKLDAAGKKTDFSTISDAIEQIRYRFSAMGIIGMTVLQNITNAAIQAGKALVSAVVSPIVQGGINRAMNIENAHFMLQGLINDETEVQAIMKDAMDSVDGTAYAYDEAAKAAAQFAATGMRSGEKMQSTLKGVAGLTAVANTEYSRVAQIYTTVAGNGRLMGDQLLQLSSLGINAAATIGKHLGKTEQEVRDMVSDGKISFDIFAAAMDDAFGEHAKKANETFNGAMSNIKSALARIGAEFVSPLIVQNGPLVKLFNDVRVKINEIKGEIGPFADLFVNSVIAIIDVLRDLLAHLDVSKVMQGLVNIMNFLVAVATKLGEAFSEIFPPFTGETLEWIVNGFHALTENLKGASENLEKVKTIFKGFFALISIIGQILGNVIKLFWNLLKVLSPVGSVIGAAAVKLSEFLIGMNAAMKETNALGVAVDFLTGIFQGLMNILKGVIGFIAGIGIAFKEGVKSATEYASSNEAVGKSLSLLEKISSGVQSAIEAIKNAFSKMGSVVHSVAEVIGKGVGKISSGLKDIFSGNFNYKMILDAINAFLFGGILVAITRFINTAKKSVENIKKITESFTDVFDALASKLRGENGEGGGIDPKQILMFASAIFILAAACFMLAGIDTAALMASITAMAALMGEIIGFVKLMDIALKGMEDPKLLTRIAVSLIPLGIAMLLFASAVKKLGSLDLATLAKGLVGLAAVLAMLCGTAKLMDKTSKSFGSMAVTLIPFATGLLILSQAVKVLGSMDILSLAKGLGALQIVLLELAAFMKLATFGKVSISNAISITILAGALNIMAIAVEKLGAIDLVSLAKGIVSIELLLLELNGFMAMLNASGGMKNAFSIGIAITLIATSMVILTQAIKQLGSMSMIDLGKGLISMAYALAVLAGAAKYIPAEGLIAKSVGLLGMAGALVILAKSVQMFGSMSLIDLAKGIGALAVSLGIMLAAMKLMNGALAGAAAMTVMAFALALLTPQLLLLSTMDIMGLFTALGALASVFVIFGVAAAILEPLIGPMIALAGAMALLGAACALIGVGVLAFSAGVIALAAAADGIIQAITNILMTVVNLIPQIAEAVVQLCLAIITGLAEAAPQIIALITQVVSYALTALTTLLPQLLTLLTAFLSGVLTMLIQLVPQVTTLIATLLSSLLQMVIDLLPQMTAAVTEIIKSILQVIVVCTPDIVNAGISIILSILTGIRDNIYQMVVIGMQIVVNFIDGIAAKIGAVIDAAFRLIISFINGLADAIRNNSGKIADAAWNLVSAIIEAIAGLGWRIIQAGKDFLQGFVNGIGSAINGAINQVTGFFGGMVDGILHFFGIKSPSRLMMGIGDYAGQGFVIGFNKNEDDAYDSGVNIGQAVVDGTKSMMEEVSDVISSLSYPIFDEGITITPTMDLSEVESGASEIDAMFARLNDTISTGSMSLNAQAISSNERRSRESGNEDTNGGGTNVTQVTNNYTQNIKSNKPIDRLTIYRQSKNLFAQAMDGTVNQT